MPVLLLSPCVSRRLEDLQTKSTDLPPSLRDQIKAAAAKRINSSSPTSSDAADEERSDDIPPPPPPPPAEKMTGSSPAIPPPRSVAGSSDARLAVPHDLLVELSKWARAKQRQGAGGRPDEDAEWTLWSLVRGSEVYIEPKPVVKRSKELEASLAAIQKAADEALYLQLTTSRPFGSNGIPSRFQSIAGVDPSSSLLARMTHSQPALSAEEDREAWKQVSSLLSVLANVLLSMAAVAAAAWYGLAASSVPVRVLVALLAALATALAETVLYARYWDYVGKSKEKKKLRAKGSDVDNSTGSGTAAPVSLASLTGGAKEQQRGAATKTELKPFSFKAT